MIAIVTAIIAAGIMLIVVAAVVCGCGHYSEPASDQDYGKNSACLHVFISWGLRF
jgi:hypothetical protein